VTDVGADEVRARARLLDGRGMLLVPEHDRTLEPWSVVRWDGVEYVVVPDPAVTEPDCFLVPPWPPGESET
jgi:hypothetical protein